MKLPKLLLLATLFSMPLAATMTPARALELDAAGWTFSPNGACSGTVLFGCYENLTPATITIYGEDATPAAPTTYQYNLDPGAQRQQVSLNYFYTLDPDSNPLASATVTVGSAAPYDLVLDQGRRLTFFWNPGETLLFSVDQGVGGGVSGSLAITDFSSQDAAPVPAPLPMAGAVALMGWSRTLRRRVRAAADSGSNRP